MICNPTNYNPFPAIVSHKTIEHNAEFYDFVRKELFLGGVVPETEEEFDQILVLLLNMEII